MGTKYETGLGGKGANQAVQCAKLGSRTIMIGAVGDDPNGKWYLENLPESGVDCSKVKVIPNVATGVAPITVATSGGGENCIVVVPGANYELAASDLTEELFQGGEIVVCQNELLHGTTQRALELAKSMGLTTVYSPAPCPTVSEFKSIASNVDYVLANESEALQLTGATDIETVAFRLNDYGAKHVIITLGAKGQAIRTDGQFQIFPAMKVDAIDTTGAGDSFAGAFVDGLNNNMTIIDALQRASKVAGLSVQKKGTQKSYPNAEDL